MKSLCGVYYNEFDPKAAAWLRELMRAGLIPEGDVDERSIADVSGDDVAGYDQCHFFAGIGGWPHALRLAGWGDRPVWTGSCPCQPYSAAGKQQGKEDSRNLWPAFRRLIALRRPQRVFGEQVSGAVGFGWIDRVRADLEAEAYALGAVVLGAHSVGAPHIRQRLYWVAHAERRTEPGHGVGSGKGSQTEITGAHAQPGRRGLHGRLADAEHAERRPEREEDGDSHGRNGSGRSGVSGGLANTTHHGQPRSGYESLVRLPVKGSSVSGGLDLAAGSRCAGDGSGGTAEPAWDKARMQESAGRSSSGRLGDAAERGSGTFDREPGPGVKSQVEAGGSDLSGGLDLAPANGRQHGEAIRSVDAEGIIPGEPWLESGDRCLSCFWDRYELVPCLDGAARRIEPGTFPLAHGIPARVGRLRGYGNAIVPQTAAEFVRAFMEIE